MLGCGYEQSKLNSLFLLSGAYLLCCSQAKVQRMVNRDAEVIFGLRGYQC